jgi:NTP pyrophosphatase (non-canonical NTP hydrolase)
MTDITHAEMVKALVKPGEDIAANITPHEADLWHAATGIVGEVGELVEAVTEHIIHGQFPDRVNLIEEFGDIEFYMEQMRQRLGLTRSDAIESDSPNDGFYPMRDVTSLVVAASHVLDAVKKSVIYKKDEAELLVELTLDNIDRTTHQLRGFFHITREETLAANIAKLSVRYAGLTYTDDAAKARADKEAVS